MAIVRIVKDGIEERTMDRVPIIGETVWFKDEDYFIVKDVWWRQDGHATIFVKTEDLDQK